MAPPVPSRSPTRVLTAAPTSAPTPPNGDDQAQLERGQAQLEERVRRDHHQKHGLGGEPDVGRDRQPREP